MLFVQKNKGESREIRARGAFEVTAQYSTYRDVQVVCKGRLQVCRENVEAFKSLDWLTAKACLRDSGVCSRQVIETRKSGMLVCLMGAKLSFNKSDRTWYDVPSIYKCARGLLNIEREQHQSGTILYSPLQLFLKL